MANYTEDDLVSLEQLVKSPGYRLLTDRLQTALELKRRSLELATENPTLYRLQGWIESARSTLDLASNMISDIKASLKS